MNTMPFWAFWAFLTKLYTFRCNEEKNALSAAPIIDEMTLDEIFNGKYDFYVWL